MTNPTPHGQVPASSAVLKAIRDANMQLVRTGDDAYMLRKAPQPSPTAQAAESVTAPAGGVVAYLDIGAGGYLDLGTDLADEALSRLPKGRHALVIAGTYGIDGYTAASTPQPTRAQAGAEQRQMDARHAAIYRWIIQHIDKAASIIDAWRDDTVIDRRNGRFHDAQRYRDFAADLLSARAQPTPPAVVVPLTDEQIVGVMHSIPINAAPSYHIAFARAIEQAHGIGETP